MFVRRWASIPVLAFDCVGATAADGPALVVDYGSTTLIPAGWRYRLDRVGNLVIRR